MLKYESVGELTAAARERGMKISRLVLLDQAEDMDQTPEELYRRRKDLYAAFADHRVENNGSPKAAAKEILELWEKSC